MCGGSDVANKINHRQMPPPFERAVKLLDMPGMAKRSREKKV